MAQAEPGHEEREDRERNTEPGVGGQELGAQQHPGEGDVEVPLSEEVVNVGKRTVSAGDIKIHKKATTEQVNVPVELKREDAVIERVPAHEMQQGGKEPFQDEHLEMSLESRGAGGGEENSPDWSRARAQD
jgi:stress response protein YsnF